MIPEIELISRREAIQRIISLSEPDEWVNVEAALMPLGVTPFELFTAIDPTALSPFQP